MDTLIVGLVNLVVVPVTGAIPLLVSSGILLAVFAAAWAAFGLAIVRDRPSLDRAWVRVRRLPLLAQALAWLLFLPILAGLWVWRTGWPSIARLAVVVGLAGWSLLIFAPHPA